MTCQDHHRVLGTLGYVFGEEDHRQRRNGQIGQRSSAFISIPFMCYYSLDLLFIGGEVNHEIDTSSGLPGKPFGKKTRKGQRDALKLVK